MTINVVVHVPEGIVMATDSRLTRTESTSDGESTHTFTLSDNAQKLVMIKNEQIGVSFSGTAIIEGATIADILRDFDIESVDEADSVLMVSEKLKRWISEKYPDYVIHFFLSGYDDDVPYVYEVTKTQLGRVNIDNEGQIFHGVSWNGDKEPVTKLIQDLYVNYTLMSLKDGIDFAEFIVDMTINYFRFKHGVSSVGGPIDILSITKDRSHFYKHKIYNP